MRVLHAPCNVGNQAATLARFERELGAASTQVSSYSTWLRYAGETSFGEPGTTSARSLALRLLYGAMAPFRFDVLHYYFARSLSCWDDFGGPNPFWYLDLRAAAQLGRKVFMTLQGCDVRLAMVSNQTNTVTPCAPGHCQAYERCLRALDVRRRRFIADILPLCDRVFYLNPELRRFLPRGEFLPYVNTDVEATEVEPPATRGRIKILHAPSDAGTKGTRLICAAIERLSERHDLELLLVQNVPHEEAQQAYRSADIAVDQVLFGWYGGLAVELMAAGKPVACYIREEDLEHVPPALARELPLARVHPDTLESDLEELIRRRAEWPALSEASRAFVLKWHNPRRIARAMLDAYADPASAFDLEGAVS